MKVIGIQIDTWEDMVKFVEASVLYHLKDIVADEETGFPRYYELLKLCYSLSFRDSVNFCLILQHKYGIKLAI